MEALNISEDNLDLDSDEMTAKKSGKLPAKEDKIAPILAEIKNTINGFISNGAVPGDIAKAIKEVYSDNGKPSANYMECKDPEVAQNILKLLKERFGGNK